MWTSISRRSENGELKRSVETLNFELRLRERELEVAEYELLILRRSNDRLEDKLETIVRLALRRKHEARTRKPNLP